jgi:hypothetical protein
MLPQAGEYNASYAEKMGGRFYMILQAVLIIFGHHVACAWGSASSLTMNGMKLLRS